MAFCACKHGLRMSLGMSIVIDYCVGFLALAYFLMISAATKQHFASEKYPIGMYVISILSLFGLTTYLWHAFLGNLDHYILPSALILIAFALFVWAIRHSSKKKLSLAFDEEPKVDGIITTGPWRYIRHPFYLSYILFWLACAIGTTHFTSIVVLATLLFIYGYSARREETILKQSPYGDEYLQYRENVGFFLPKLVSRS